MSLRLPPNQPVSDNEARDSEHGHAMPMGITHANAPLPPDRGVSDNAPRTPERGDPMDAGTPHGHTPIQRERPVSDPPPYTPGLGLEIAARMAREWLARLDAEAAEEWEA